MDRAAEREHWKLQEETRSAAAMRWGFGLSPLKAVSSGNESP